MFKKIADNREVGSLAVQFRKKRFAFFSSLLSRLDRPVSILDIGGTETYWKTMNNMESDLQVFITLLNLSKDDITLPNVLSVIGDARDIQFEDGKFDVVFSNSVIEHVGQRTDQKKMADEIRRVGKRYFIQTPNKYFPIEPHFLFPFFQFLPVSLRVGLLKNFDLGWFKRTTESEKAKEVVEGIRLLGKREFRELFPNARLYQEKILWMTKSFVAYEGWDD